MKNLTSKEISEMNYTDFIAFIKETNRCPGGKDTVRKIALNSFINSESKVLEVGSNTGFTSLEIAHLVKCTVEGIDVSASCIEEANSRLALDTEQIQNLVNFQVASAYDIPFKDESFDLVVAGGATSFMDEKNKAISEYSRVVRPWGFISVTQLYYATTPPASVIENVSRAIGVNINPWSEEDWLDVFNKQQHNLELYFYEKGELMHRTEEEIEEYVSYFLSKSHIKDLDTDTLDVIKAKWISYIDVFNENHKYLGYFTALFRKPVYSEEPELFIRKS